MTERKIYKLKKEDRPFVCDKCNKTFKEERHYKSHQNRKTPCIKEFKCNKCNKVFQNNTFLSRHLNRKTPCALNEIPVITIDNVENRCQFCNKTYSSKSNLNKHQKSCNTASNPQAMQRLMDMVLDLTQEVKELKGKQPAINNTLNQTLNVQQNLYMNVTFCSFGNEDFSKLDSTKVMQLLRGQVKDFMSKMIEYIHTDPDHPELHNVFYDPIRKKAIVFTRISDNEMSWQTRDFREVSDILTDKIKDHVAPGNGPYFDMAMKERDYDTSNNIINIAKHINWKTDEFVEMNQKSLSKLAKNNDFMDHVQVQELE